MSKPLPYPLIFTDLDGTLLDHHSYSAKPADQLIEYLNDGSIASVIPITSKTHAELQWLQRSLPFIDAISVTENGSVIHAPHGIPFSSADHPYRETLGVEYGEIFDQIARLPTDLRTHITGFHDMSVETVAQITGLSIDDARRAQKREATEPFLWSGSNAELQFLKTIFMDASIYVQQGGRFYHCTGMATKEQAMGRVIAAFASRQPENRFCSIALGDGPNDLAMIEAADFGVIMPNPEGVTIQSDKVSVRTAPQPGPKGWVLAITEILAELGFNLSQS
ncbi:MAG: HAD-IIB family hydrolase [Parasphingorhabdus sp.]|uniref:HAD-IIB family hydrolase n=1 Tax=Parasphingorhabdus sp. TaxID=2709688 RepID=UPI00300343D9